MNVDVAQSVKKRKRPRRGKRTWVSAITCAATFIIASSRATAIVTVDTNDNRYPWTVLVRRAG